jgi:hypothetical protein
MKIIYFIITTVILALTACQLLQKDKQTLKKISLQEEHQMVEHRNSLSQHSELLLVDSSQNKFTMLVYPKGKFTLSVANGFEGEAEKILIKGEHNSHSVESFKQQIEKDSLAIKANYIKQEQRITTANKKKLSAGSNSAWLLVIPVGYMLWLLYRNFLR